MYPFAKSSCCLIWFVTEGSEDPRPEVKGILQSQTTPVKLIQSQTFPPVTPVAALIFWSVLVFLNPINSYLSEMLYYYVKYIYYFTYIYLYKDAASCFLKKMTVSIQIGLLILCFTNSLSPHR